MAQGTAIEWTYLPGYVPRTWNPLAGCTRASIGCDSCYAAGMAIRLEAMARADRAAGKDPGGKTKYIGTARRNHAGRAAFVGVVNLDWAALNEPATWTKPSAVFVNSMSDLFHPNAPDQFILEAFRVMERTPQHIYMVLTKRPERMAEWLQHRARHNPHLCPAPNIWCGTSTENQEWADKRIPHLLNTPAAVRFLSCEPLLGPINLSKWLICERCNGEGTIHHITQMGKRSFAGQQLPCPACKGGVWRHDLSWVIGGGESGSHARPCWPDWARLLRDQCQDASIAYFWKQWGEYEPYEEDAQPPFWRDQHDCLHDGHWLNIIDPETCGMGKGWHEDSLLSPYAFRRVGKHNAGRLLDGVEWNQFPNVKEAVARCRYTGADASGVSDGDGVRSWCVL